MAAFLLGWLISLLTGSRNWASAAALLWWISPFHIIFCAISLPVIVINALILGLFVLLFFLFQNIGRLARLLARSVAAAIVLAAENSFRPITIITIISCVVFYALYALQARRLQVFGHCLLSAGAIILLSSLLQYGWTQVVCDATGLPANTNPQGWSIFVGGNYESSGRWNLEDRGYLTSTLDACDGDYSMAFSRLQREGIERWKALGPAKSAFLLAKKSVYLTGNHQNMLYNLAGSYPFWKEHSRMYDILRALCGVYWVSTLWCALAFAARRRRAKALDFIVFLNILVLALFPASLLVEVAGISLYSSRCLPSSACWGCKMR